MRLSSPEGFRACGLPARSGHRMALGSRSCRSGASLMGPRAGQTEFARRQPAASGQRAWSRSTTDAGMGRWVRCCGRPTPWQGGLVVPGRRGIPRERQLAGAGDEVAPRHRRAGGAALGAPSAEDLLHVALDLEVINRAMSWRSDITTDVPKFAYWRVTPASDPAFDLGKASAEDSEWPQRNLYGERWGRFGAVASRGRSEVGLAVGPTGRGMTLSKQILCDAKAPDSDVRKVNPTRGSRRVLKRCWC
jgi:hypothetical protein